MYLKNVQVIIFNFIKDNLAPSKKAPYFSKYDSNEYIEMLLRRGYIVAKYAHLTFPEGIEITGDKLDKAIVETKILID